MGRVNFQLGMAGPFFPSPVHEDRSPVTGKSALPKRESRRGLGRVLLGVTLTAAVTKVPFVTISADILKND